MNVSKSPLVSVLMTAYNREKFIAEAIESVLQSTYQNFELIIVDDCSKDKTVDIAKSYAAKDSRIKVFVNEKNLDQFPNRNKAASLAKGKYLKYLDSDDTIYDWGLDYCVGMMEKYPDAGMGMFQANNKVEEEYLAPFNSINFHFFRSPFLLVGPSGIVLRKDAFESAGSFNPSYGVPSDMYFNIKMASLFPVVMLKKEFFFYREHEGQEIKNRDSYLFNNYPFMRDILELPELPVSAEGKKKLLVKARKSLLRACAGNIMDTHRTASALHAIKISGLKFPDIVKTLLS